MSPNQPRTPARTVRIDDATWSALQAQATRDGVTVSEIVRAALAAYVQDPAAPYDPMVGN